MGACNCNFFYVKNTRQEIRTKIGVVRDKDILEGLAEYSDDVEEPEQIKLTEKINPDNQDNPEKQEQYFTPEESKAPEIAVPPEEKKQDEMPALVPELEEPVKVFKIASLAEEQDDPPDIKSSQNLEQPKEMMNG